MVWAIKDKNEQKWSNVVTPRTEFDQFYLCRTHGKKFLYASKVYYVYLFLHIIYTTHQITQLSVTNWIKWSKKESR